MFMNWRNLLKADLGQLLRGKVRACQPASRKMSLSAASGTIMRLAEITALNAPLVPAIEEMIPDAPRAEAHVLVNLREALNQGNSLSDAMRLQPRSFPRYQVDLVKAAEDSGTLPEALLDIKESREEWISVWTQAFSDVYIALLTAMTVTVILIFTSSYILPKWVEMLEGFGAPLPGTALFLSSVASMFLSSLEEIGGTFSFGHSRSSSGGVGLIALIVMALGAVFFCWIYWSQIRNGVREIIARLPLFRSIIVYKDLAHCSAILQKLVAAGYPLDEALDSASKSHIIRNLSAAFVRIRDRLQQGETFTVAASQEKCLPRSFCMYVALGEASSTLDQWLDGMYHYYSINSIKLIRILSTVLFPIHVVVMGCLVLLLYSALFQSMIAVADAIIGDL